MQYTTFVTNLANFFKVELENQLKTFITDLEAGNLLGFEEKATIFSNTIYDEIVKNVLIQVINSPVFLQKQQALAQQKRMGKLSKRSVKLQIRTGTYLDLEILYAKKCPKSLEGSRYLAFRYWGVIQNASPSCYSQASMFSVLCGSYDTAKQAFDSLHISNNIGRIRDLSWAVAGKCLSNRPPVMLLKTETLAGKQVVLSMDGGRTRTREYKSEMNDKKSHHKFDTPWKEPKLFVITIIDKDGKIDKKELPIYDNAFGESPMFELLKKYLISLNVNQVTRIQCIADGALWIWNHVKDMLLALGVSAEKIIETVDYYHAVEHLKRLVEALPQKIKKANLSLFTDLKDDLWAGNIFKIVEKIKSFVSKVPKKIKTELGYFTKNQARMRYEYFRNQNLLCGSGIIESGVRRMINLRFKCPSAFWKLENLEGLIFLRCALLSKRWNIMMNNLIHLQ